VSHAFDGANRLESVIDAGQRTTSFIYDAASNPLTANLPNGLQRRYSYDIANRLLGIDNWQGTTKVEGVDYTLDANGNRLTAGELIAAPVGGGASLSRTVSYAYDPLNRLTGASYTDGASTEGYSYDAAGNRPSATIGGNTTSSTFDAANRLLTSGGDSYTYDADGNTLTAGARTYAWNAANRMVSVTLAPGANPITYAYNGNGVLVSRSSAGQSTAYLQDVAAGLPVVLRENGPSGQIDYTWARGLLSQQDPTGYYTALADGLGSVRALANSQGQVAGSFAYDSFGNPQGTQGGPATTNYHFAGEQTDPATGLIDLRARSYDPHAGRFTTRDALVQGGIGTQGFHRYAYVGNNPVGLTDPNGKTNCPHEGAGLGGGDVASGIHIELPVIGCIQLPQPPKLDAGFNPDLGGGCLWTPPTLDRGPLDSFPEQGGHTIVDPIYDGANGDFVASSAGGDSPTGGRYRDIPANGGQVHHMPADSVSPLPRNDGPAIRMETGDHQQTASWGNSNDAQAYRAQQQQLIDHGQFEGAIVVDINDIQSKFGNKYDHAILQMIDSLPKDPSSYYG
jgi:RHS repeat-associated protein